MDSNNKISNIAVCYCLKYLTQVSYSRWVQTVHQSVLKYCLIETDPLTSTQRFRVPTFEVDISGAAEWSAPTQCTTLRHLSSALTKLSLQSLHCPYPGRGWGGRGGGHAVHLAGRGAAAAARTLQPRGAGRGRPGAGDRGHHAAGAGRRGDQVTRDWWRAVT